MKKLTFGILILITVWWLYEYALDAAVSFMAGGEVPVTHQVVSAGTTYQVCFAILVAMALIILRSRIVRLLKAVLTHRNPVRTYKYLSRPARAFMRRQKYRRTRHPAEVVVYDRKADFQRPVPAMPVAAVVRRPAPIDLTPTGPTLAQELERIKKELAYSFARGLRRINKRVTQWSASMGRVMDKVADAEMHAWGVTAAFCRALWRVARSYVAFGLRIFGRLLAIIAGHTGRGVKHGAGTAARTTSRQTFKLLERNLDREDLAVIEALGRQMKLALFSWRLSAVPARVSAKWAQLKSIRPGK
jgi:hypothetical protein